MKVSKIADYEVLIDSIQNESPIIEDIINEYRENGVTIADFPVFKNKVQDVITHLENYLSQMEEIYNEVKE